MHNIAEASTWVQYLLLLPLGIVLLVAAITDWRNRKIYNWLTYPAFVIGLIVHTVAFGFSGLLAGALTGFGVVFVGLLILPFGWLGGGDIKLLAVIGATLGPLALYEIFAYSIFVGFVMAICLSLVNGYLWTLIKKLGRFLRSLFLTISAQTNLTEKLETDERGYLPFAIPIFVGAIFATTDVYFQWPLFLDWIRQTMRAVFG